MNDDNKYLVEAYYTGEYLGVLELTKDEWQKVSNMNHVPYYPTRKEKIKWWVSDKLTELAERLKQ